ncbi:MAG: two pore domain potassium channel family protein [Alphaproteobacteria bacterium]|nr:two pore domain potassium channel family protein [Alphaproteobacteria bacterium]
MVEHLVWLISVAMVLITVTVHYEIMTVVSDRVIPWAQRHVHSRRVMTFAIAGLLCGHIAEIGLFALAIKLLVFSPAFGSIQGDFSNLWGDFFYLSAVNYTSLGDNTIHLIGPARALSVSEALAGMMMIAWSASFTYLKMESIWERRRKPRD